MGEIVPEEFLMRRPPGDSSHNVHSAGRVVDQPGMPEFWVPLNYTKL